MKLYIYDVLHTQYMHMSAGRKKVLNDSIVMYITSQRNYNEPVQQHSIHTKRTNGAECETYYM